MAKSIYPGNTGRDAFSATFPGCARTCTRMPLLMFCLNELEESV